MRLLVDGCYQTYLFPTELSFSGVKKTVEYTVEVKLYLPLCIGIFLSLLRRKFIPVLSFNF